MNSLEAEYSFLAPTWKLPSVATTSMYSPYGTSYSSNTHDSGPDWSLWNNTMYNSRYIPAYAPTTTARRNYPILPNYQPTGGYPTQSGPSYYQQTNNQQTGGYPTQSGPSYHQPTNNQHGKNPKVDDGLNLTISLHPNNEYESYNNQSQQHPINRGLTYSTNGQNNLSHPPPGQKRRVQIIDHNRQTPSTVMNDYASGRQSHNSTNEYLASHQNYTSETNRSQQKSKPSNSNQYHDHVEENRYGYTGNNFNIHEYLYGLSEPDPGSYANAFKQQQRRLQDEKVGRKSVISEYKTFVQNGGFGPTFGNMEHQTYGDKVDSDKKKKIYSKTVRSTNQYKIEEQKRMNNGYQKTRPVPVPKSQRARAYAEKIEKPHNLKPVFQTESSSQIPIISPILITSLSNHQRRSSLDSIHSSILNESLSDNRSRCSSSTSSIRPRRRVRFHSRDFIRRPSSTINNLPTCIIGKGILNSKDFLSIRYHTEKSASKLLDEKDEQQNINVEHFKNSSNNFSFSSTSNENEKKSIISHSMLTAKNMRLPPTATVLINQTYKPSFIATTTNNQLKKSTVNKEILTSQRPLTARSIPVPYRKSSIISNPDFDLGIKSFHHTDDSLYE